MFYDWQAEIIATCQTNMKCLQSVYDHLPVDATEEETEKLKGRSSKYLLILYFMSLKIRIC